MTGLALDTAGEVLSVALRTTEGLYLAEIDAGLRHSERLMELVDSLFSSARMPPAELSFVACLGGPGSFTGLRIGMSTAKGLAVSLGIPLYSVPTLDCVAYSHRVWPGPVIPVIDARRGRWFAAPFRSGERLAQDAELGTEELADLTGGPQGGALLCGPGAEAASEAILRAQSFRPEAEVFGRRGRGRELLDLAQARFSSQDPGEKDEVGLQYLRKSEAELTREAAQRKV